MPVRKAPAVPFGVSSFSGLAASGSSPGGQPKALHRIFSGRGAFTV
jgi:hypothetical protein